MTKLLIWEIGQQIIHIKILEDATYQTTSNSEIKVNQYQYKIYKSPKIANSQKSLSKGPKKQAIEVPVQHRKRSSIKTEEEEEVVEEEKEEKKINFPITAGWTLSKRFCFSNAAPFFRIPLVSYGTIFAVQKVTHANHPIPDPS